MRMRTSESDTQTDSVKSVVALRAYEVCSVTIVLRLSLSYESLAIDYLDRY